MVFTIRPELMQTFADAIYSLEKPCLPHTHVNPEDHDASTGHALTASFEIMQRADTGDIQPSASLWQDDPKTTLQRLLNASPDLSESEELTPVQAWMHISSRADLATLEMHRFERLMKDLLKHVKCYG